MRDAPPALTGAAAALVSFGAVVARNRLTPAGLARAAVLQRPPAASGKTLPGLGDQSGGRALHRHHRFDGGWVRSDVDIPLNRNETDCNHDHHGQQPAGHWPARTGGGHSGRHPFRNRLGLSVYRDIDRCVRAHDLQHFGVSVSVHACRYVGQMRNYGQSCEGPRWLGLGG